ncbi:putative protein FAR1-RELATED SEQUENCE 10, partial [Mucuna pruriens]
MIFKERNGIVEYKSSFCLNLRTLISRFHIKGKYLTMMKMLKSGFSIRRDHIYKCSKSESKENPLGIYKREFVCHCVDNVKHCKVIESERQRNKKSSRCNYSAKMWFSKRRIGFEEQWIVACFNNSNNHEFFYDKEVQYLYAYHDIPIGDQNRILLWLKAGCPRNSHNKSA